MNVIRPTLKRLHSPDMVNLESYNPDNKTCFGFLLQAMFGPENADGEESFDIFVCSPEWLAQEASKKAIINGRHHLILNEYDINKVRSFLIEYCRQCEGYTWQEVATKLSRIGKWEFEDYQD